MLRDEAMIYLKALLEGVDPLTGKFLPQRHLCRDDSIRTALGIAVQAMQVAPEDELDCVEPQWVKISNKPDPDRLWTSQESDELCEMFRDGAEIDTISRRLQRNQRSVEQKLVELGMVGVSKLTCTPAQKPPGQERRGTPWFADDDKMLWEMYEQRRPAKEIAVALHRSEYGVYCRMERLGLTGDVDGYPVETEQDAWSCDDQELLRELYERGFSAEDIAGEMNRPLGSVRGRLFASGLSREAPFSLRTKK